MKPIIIIKETNKDGKFELTEQELKELIEKAYEQGFENAKAQYQPNITPCKFTPGNYVTDEPCTPSYPRDVFGNPITIVNGGTASDSKDNRRVTLNGTTVSTGV